MLAAIAEHPGTALRQAQQSSLDLLGHRRSAPYGDTLTIADVQAARA